MLSILYEDGQIIAVNKPAPLLTQAPPGIPSMEAFVKAHLHWGRIRRYDDPAGWIRRVAINRLRDDHRHSVRKQRAHNCGTGSPPVQESHSSLPGPGPQLLTRQGHRRGLALT